MAAARNRPWERECCVSGMLGGFPQPARSQARFRGREITGAGRLRVQVPVRWDLRLARGFAAPVPCDPGGTCSRNWPRDTETAGVSIGPARIHRPPIPRNGQPNHPAAPGPRPNRHPSGSARVAPEVDFDAESNWGTYGFGKAVAGTETVGVSSCLTDLRRRSNAAGMAGRITRRRRILPKRTDRRPRPSEARESNLTTAGSGRLRPILGAGGFSCGVRSALRSASGRAARIDHRTNRWRSRPEPVIRQTTPPRRGWRVMGHACSSGFGPLLGPGDPGRLALHRRASPPSAARDGPATRANCQEAHVPPESDHPPAASRRDLGRRRNWWRIRSARESGGGCGAIGTHVGAPIRLRAAIRPDTLRIAWRPRPRAARKTRLGRARPERAILQASPRS